MLYRHPSILKYISSWHKSSKFHLAVEEVTPLFLALPNQSLQQICIGLHSILKALCFLHEKAAVNHNNVCGASIYVTNDGSWRLGGMEYLCRIADINADYLSKTREHRYKKAVDSDEDKVKLFNVIDVYAFGVLAEEVLTKKSDGKFECHFDACKQE